MTASDPHQPPQAKPNRPVSYSQKATSGPNWGNGLTGFLFGLALVLVFLGVPAAREISARQQAVQPTQAHWTRTSTPRTWPTPTPAPTSLAAEATPDTFQLVQEMVNGGQSQQAIEILGPQVDQLPTVAKKKESYLLLARAELNQGNYNLAAAYLEKARSFGGDVMLLWNAAEAYDQGGALECALDRYQSVVKEKDSTLDLVRPTAEARAAALSKIFPTQMPCK
ncbi:MAG TPA: hypothetical protein VMT46_17050 [Anaerolineaceae bacterium]|nr:hypothetical protein [Anaerolineaceae bacterium]